MTLNGHIQNGVVVFDGATIFPEGTRVIVSQVAPLSSVHPPDRRRVEFPLVRAGIPGSVILTNQRIAEILEEEDLAALNGTPDVSS